ncbi:hypothetical protein KHQ81_06370 [Mycoplasmatota bacterium]|nr:hypothetical protein KHQ81_06370 [Mycoplasmatota bacterium]
MKKGLLIKRKDNKKSLEISIIEINKHANVSELHQIYKHLNVDLIDIVSYQGKTIYFDDEGLLKADPQVTLLLNDRNQYLYGNVLIMGNCDENGEILGISTKDIELLKSNLQMVKNLETNSDVVIW